jgi:hypothetical protein
MRYLKIEITLTDVSWQPLGSYAKILDIADDTNADALHAILHTQADVALDAISPERTDTPCKEVGDDVVGGNRAAVDPLRVDGHGVLDSELCHGGTVPSSSSASTNMPAQGDAPAELNPLE